MRQAYPDSLPLEPPLNTQAPDLAHDVRAERRTLALMSIGFGLVGLDRWMIAPLFPHMMTELHLNYQNLGEMVGILGVAWGLCASLMGRLADRVGRKQILLWAMLAFSLLSSCTGFAGNMLGLLLIRGAMGLAEGAFLPASLAEVGEATLPARRGRNQGLQLGMFSLLGFGFGPIVATQLLRVLPSWHWVFAISALPGLIVAALIARYIPKHAGTVAVDSDSHRKLQWVAVLRSRNVWLAMLGTLCAMAGIFVIGSMVPSYLTEYLHLSASDMGLVNSAMGFGGFLGAFALPTISDYIGRRSAAIAGFALGAVALWIFARIGPDPLLLFAVLFVVAFFALGMVGLLTGPISTEAAPAGLVASAIGLTSGAGEIFGAGVAPVLAGHLAQHHGIQSTLIFALGGLLCGVIVVSMLRETAPRRIRG